MITDMHCHFVPGTFFRFVEGREEFAVKVERTEGEDISLRIRGIPFDLNTTFFKLDRQVARLDRLGIDRTILSLATPFIDYHLDARLAIEAARIYNDSLAREIDGKAARFGGWAFLPLQDPDAAAAELRRCVRDLGFVGGHVASNVRGVYLHDERFRPVFEAATELDVPLFVHPADPAGRDRTREYELTVVAGYLFDNTINIFNIVCSGFLDRWPRLKLLFAHTGAFSLVLRARMQCEIDTNPRRPYGHLKRSIGDYLSMLYYDTACFDPKILRFATESVPVEHFVMGSDAPFPLVVPNPVTFVRDALPAKEAELVLGRNFDRLIGEGVMELRRLIVVKDTVHAEGGQSAVEPVTRVAACAVIANPLAGQASDALEPLVTWGAELGERLVKECVAMLPHPAVAYGKGAIVGTGGDIEHAAALIHPRMGKPMRDAIGGGQALIPSNVKIGSAGASIDIPLGHKDDMWSFNEIDTLTVTIGGAPRPNEIVVIVALSDGGRPRPRVAKSGAVPPPGPRSR